MQPTTGLIAIDELRRRYEIHHDNATQYQKHEYEIREKLQRFFDSDSNITSILFTCPFTDTYAECDCLIISASTSIYVEAKERTYRSTAYASWFFDQEKIDKLLALQATTDTLTMLCATFPDEVAMLWRLDDFSETRDINCNRKTFDSDLGKVTKKMFVFDSKNATILQ